MSKKYSDFLTIILVLVIIAIMVIIGYLGYKYYETYTTKTNSEEFVGSFVEDSENNPNTSTENEDTNIEGDEDWFIKEEEPNTSDNNSNSSTKKVKKYNGFEVAGTIEIPATNLKCPVISKSEYSKKSLETSVVELYGDGLNQVGNTTIAGHNYRNGTFFSNNKKLAIGDKIYITDSTGEKVEYTIYNTYLTSDTDFSYATRNTSGKREISLSTCTNDSSKRLVIWAKE